jgi:hypothetical protein
VSEYTTADGKPVKTGDRVFSHYTMTDGVIGEQRGAPDWFTFEDGFGNDMLDGSRIVSLEHARKMGWLGDGGPLDAESARVEAVLDLATFVGPAGITAQEIVEAFNAGELVWRPREGARLGRVEREGAARDDG